MELHANRLIFLMTIIAALGGLLIGCDAGIITDYKDQLTARFSLSDLEWSVIASVSIVGSIIAIPISGKAADYLGRKFMLILVALGFISGLILTSTAQTLSQFVCGRFLIGLCIGIASYTSPLFISEIAPSGIRGGLVLVNGFAIAGGQTLSFLLGYFLHDLSTESWRLMLLLELIPAFILFFGIFFMPQSPRWVAMRYGIDKAISILKKIRPDDPQKIAAEIDEIQNNILHHSAVSNLRNLFSKRLTPVLIIGFGLAVFQQFSGISAILYYGPVIFNHVGFVGIKSAIFATFILGLINTLFTIVSIFLVDYLGRRFLLLTGTLIAALSLFFAGVVHWVWADAQWIFLICMCTYTMGYCISLGSLFWLIISEVYPLNIRGLAMSMATAMQCGANFIVTLTFLTLIQYMGLHQTLWIYAINCVISFIFIYNLVPETKGTTLEQIEANLDAGKPSLELGQSLTVLPSNLQEIENQ